MDLAPRSGDEFAALLDAGEWYEGIVGSEGRLVLVDGDRLPDTLGRRAMERLHTLPAVVTAVVADPDTRRPVWADLVVGPGSPALDAAAVTIEANPGAATTLAVLLRNGQHRSIAEGLIEESLAYGLLQAGPEFTTWRREHPARTRPPVTEPSALASRDGGELSVTLNRPHVRNALDAGMRDELLALLHVATVDRTVTSVVVRGNGASFSSGGDLDEFGSRPDPVTAHLVRLQRNLGRTMAELADRTTVHLQGATVGSGIELAAFAHRVVADPSTRISLPEVHLGLIPGAGGTVSLPRRIGRHATMLLAVGLPSIDAETARRWGLVDELEP